MFNRKEYMKNWRIKNKEHIESYNILNKERHNESNRIYRLNNPEKVKKWKESHKDYNRIWKKKYYDKFPEKIIQENKLWNENHKEQVLEAKKIRSKRKDVHFKQYLRQYDLRHYKKDKCEICGSINNLQIHHKTYEKGNIMILCIKCHLEMHNKQYRRDVNVPIVEEG